VEIKSGSVMLRITERPTLCNSRPSGTQQIRQCCGIAILSPQNSCKLCNILRTQAPRMSILAVSDHRPPHSHYIYPTGKANAELVVGTNVFWMGCLP